MEGGDEATVEAVKEQQGQIVLQQIATDVLQSHDAARLSALSSLAKDHLIEFELASYLSAEVLRLRMGVLATPSSGVGAGAGDSTGYNDPKVNVAIAKSELANILSDQSDHAKAYVLYEETLAIFTETLGGQHIEVSKVLNSMTATKLFQRKYEDAKVHCTRALSIQTELLGPDHLLVGQTTSNLGTVMLALEDWDAALELFETSKRIQIATSGMNDPAVGGTINNIAMVHRRKGNLDVAFELYQEALEHYRHVCYTRGARQELLLERALKCSNERIASATSGSVSAHVSQRLSHVWPVWLQRFMSAFVARSKNSSNNDK